MDKELREQIKELASSMKVIQDCSGWQGLAAWHIQRTLEARITEHREACQKYGCKVVEDLQLKLQQLKDG